MVVCRHTPKTYYIYNIISLLSPGTGVVVCQHTPRHILYIQYNIFTVSSPGVVVCRHTPKIYYIYNIISLLSVVQVWWSADIPPRFIVYTLSYLYCQRSRCGGLPTYPQDILYNQYNFFFFFFLICSSLYSALLSAGLPNLPLRHILYTIDIFTFSGYGCGGLLIYPQDIYYIQYNIFTFSGYRCGGLLIYPQDIYYIQYNIFTFSGYRCGGLPIYPKTYIIYNIISLLSAGTPRTYYIYTIISLLSAGTGVVGVVVCRRNPQMSVTLVDKAAVLKLAKDHFVPADLSNRITYLAGKGKQNSLLCQVKID